MQFSLDRTAEMRLTLADMPEETANPITALFQHADYADAPGAAFRRKNFASPQLDQQ